MEWSHIILAVVRFLTYLPKLLSKPSRQSKRIQGKWKYRCVLKAPYQFLDGGNSHGGECTIKVKTTLLSTQVMIRGERKWFADYDSGKRENIHDLDPHMLWQSEEGAFLSDSRFMYKYKIDNRSVEGITIVDILNNGKEIEGTFYYFPDDPDVGAHQNNFQIISNSKPEKIGRFFKVYGHVLFERIK